MIAVNDQIQFPAKERTEWLAAMRSGKYKLGNKWLRSTADEFCPLGVFYDLRGVTWLAPDEGKPPAYNVPIDQQDAIARRYPVDLIFSRIFDRYGTKAMPAQIVDFIEHHTTATTEANNA